VVRSLLHRLPALGLRFSEGSHERIVGEALDPFEALGERATRRSPAARALPSAIITGSCATSIVVADSIG